MKWYEKIKSSENPKVISMLSGGKDSIVATILLKKEGIDVTAIHFIHKWCESIPTEEAIRICKLYDIPLIIKDYTKEFCEAVNNYKGGRPCLICKKEMYKVLLKNFSNQEYGWLCIGDNANDRTTIMRIKDHILKTNKENLECNSYFGSELGIKLPDKMKVVRPLINIAVKDVEGFLEKEKIKIKRINSTGDKYFEYHREGCPIQFADFGVSLNENLYDDLKKYNECITKFAREKNILASIHMPSTFIITIPTGYERQAIEYLKQNKLEVNLNNNSSKKPKENIINGSIYEIKKELFNEEVYKKIFNRFLERLELFGNNKKILKDSENICCLYSDENSRFNIYFDFKSLEVELIYKYNQNSSGRKEEGIVENIIIELFRTRKYSIRNYSI